MAQKVNGNEHIAAAQVNGAANHLLRSNEVSEIISHKPGFLIRWGISVFFVMLLFIVFVTWFIQYPDVVPAKAKLTSINAPKAVVTKQAGKLIKLFAKENEFVKQGTVLGYMESITKHSDVIILSGIIDSMQMMLSKNNTEEAISYFQSFTSLPSSPFPPPLGEIEGALSTFMLAYFNFSNYLSGGFYLRKKAMLYSDVNFMQRLQRNLNTQKELNTADLVLTQQTFTANESLKKDNVISDFDFRNEKSKLIGKKLTLPQINAAIINNQSQQHEKRKEIAELENTIAQQKNIFAQALNTFKSQIDDWKKIYLLTAPVDGKISFATFLQENQQLQGNQTICFVNPGNTEYYAEVYIPQANFGKIKMGQQVLLKFPAYPFQEYGSLTGRLDFISNITTDSGYLAKVILPNGLNTSYNKQIQFREGLQAQGEVITANMRLLQRFYYSIVKQVEK